jgi:shikimate kinase
MKRVYLIGIMGSGKTYWGKLLAQSLDLPFVDLDEFVSEREGKSVATIFEESGEDYFRQMETSALRSIKLAEPVVIACGGGTPCFHNNMDFMLHHGIVVWLNTDTEVVVDRIWKAKHKRPLIAKAETKEEVTALINSIVEKRKQWYGLAHITLTGSTIDLPVLKAMITSFSNNNLKQ